jgi:hypothetical protein
MKTIILGIVIGLVGCGEAADYPRTEDAGTDACVAAQGNCGCVLVDTITHPDGSPNFVRVDHSTVVCP